MQSSRIGDSMEPLPLFNRINSEPIHRSHFDIKNLKIFERFWLI